MDPNRRQLSTILVSCLVLLLSLAPLTTASASEHVEVTSIRPGITPLGQWEDPAPLWDVHGGARRWKGFLETRVWNFYAETFQVSTNDCSLPSQTASCRAESGP